MVQSDTHVGRGLCNQPPTLTDNLSRRSSAMAEKAIPGATAPSTTRRRRRTRSFGSITQLPSGRWRARYRHPATGERLAAPTTFHTRAEASNWLATIEASIIERRWADPNDGSTPLAEWSREWLASAHDLKRRTRSGYASILDHHLLPALGRVALADVDAAGVQRLVNDLAGAGARPQTVANIVRTLGTVMNGAVAAGRLRSYPVRLGKHGNVRLPRDTAPADEMVTTDDAGVARLAAALSDARPDDARPSYDPGLMVLTATYAGALRWGELAGLTVGDVDIPGRRLHVRRVLVCDAGNLVEEVPKSKASRRTVPIPNHIYDRLATHVAGRRPTERVFTSERGLPLRHSSFYARTYRPAVAEAGLPDAFRFHDLRHTGVTIALAVTGDLAGVSRWCGHGDVAITSRVYSHALPGAHDRLGDALAAGWEAATRPILRAVQ
jgi:integrase